MKQDNEGAGGTPEVGAEVATPRDVAELADAFEKALLKIIEAQARVIASNNLGLVEGEIATHLLAEIDALRSERDRLVLTTTAIADSLNVLREHYDALRAELAGAEERGAARERAATVAWCGSNTAWGIVGKVGFGHSDVHTAVTRLAECIERGDHVRTGTAAADAGESQP